MHSDFKATLSRFNATLVEGNNKPSTNHIQGTLVIDKCWCGATDSSTEHRVWVLPFEGNCSQLECTNVQGDWEEFAFVRKDRKRSR